MKRLAFVLYSSVVGLVLFEAVLQGAALATRWLARDGLASVETRGAGPREVLRVLCIGDSNTYGIGVARDETWPAQLEALWNGAGREPRLEVVNLGFPGTNSSRVVRDLPRLLELLQPDATIVMLGVNDFWTVPFPVDEAEDESVWETARRSSRVYRLLLLLLRGREGARLEDAQGLEIEADRDSTLVEGGYTLRIGEEEFRMDFRSGQGRRGSAPATLRDLRRNLEIIARQAGRADTRLVFMTYPARLKSFYRMANPAIAEIAARTETPLVDLTAVFERLCPELACPAYLLDDDHHPNGDGYRLVAETLVAQLPDLLR